MIFTRQQLDKELELINPKLDSVRSGFHFVALCRNGYTGLDLFCGDQSEVLATGSPSYCFDAACRYIVLNMKVN